MKIDTFVQLIKNLSTNSIDDTDPNNTILQEYTTPFDTVSMDDSIRVMKSGTFVWGDGTTFTATDSNQQSFQAPSCGWLWGAGGRWSDGASDGYSGSNTAGGGVSGGSSSGTKLSSIQNQTWSSIASSTWGSL